MILILFGCIFFAVGLVGLLDDSNIYAVYVSFGVGLFLCLLGLFKKEC